jgi:hypothetical protein
MNYQRSWDAEMYDFIGVLLIYMMMLISINDENDIKTFIWGYIIIFAFIAYEPFYYYFTGTEIDFAKTEEYGVVYKGRVGYCPGTCHGE